MNASYSKSLRSSESSGSSSAASYAPSRLQRTSCCGVATVAIGSIWRKPSRRTVSSTPSAEPSSACARTAIRRACSADPLREFAPMSAGSYGGSTPLVALLGQPVAHSLSPLMQNAAFAARGLDWAYVACEVTPERFEAAIRGLAALGFAGAHVTIPHKETAARLCDEADGDAVNTLVFRDGRVLGSNTDREIVRGIDTTRACL